MERASYTHVYQNGHIQPAPFKTGKAIHSLLIPRSGVDTVDRVLGESLLQKAAKVNEAAIVVQLLREGADLQHVSNIGWTARDYFVAAGHKKETWVNLVRKLRGDEAADAEASKEIVAAAAAEPEGTDWQFVVGRARSKGVLDCHSTSQMAFLSNGEARAAIGIFSKEALSEVARQIYAEIRENPEDTALRGLLAFAQSCMRVGADG